MYLFVGATKHRARHAANVGAQRRELAARRQTKQHTDTRVALIFSERSETIHQRQQH